MWRVFQATSGLQPPHPTSFTLSEAAPNPFNPATSIRYEVPRPTHVTLSVFNVLGQEVVQLVDGIRSAGRYAVTWDGTDGQGTTVASGIYLYRITTAEGSTDSRRMVLLK